MSAQQQTSFPFNIQICLNGREWLARRFQPHGTPDFTRNCFTHLGDAALGAQRLMAHTLRTGWQRVLDPITRTLNPLYGPIFRRWPHTYYWSAYQTEWATDLLFADSATLAALRTSFVTPLSPDVMRFLGRKGLHGRFQGKLGASCQRRLEGMRIKHWMQGNSLKMYDEAARLLRVETTIGKIPLSSRCCVPASARAAARAGLATPAQGRGQPPWPCCVRNGPRALPRRARRC